LNLLGWVWELRGFGLNGSYDVGDATLLKTWCRKDGGGATIDDPGPGERNARVPRNALKVWKEKL